jgi:hypothetical protein
MSYVTITLDTTAPSNPTIQIAGGQAFATAQLVNLTLSTDDTDKTGYEMLIWGDVDTTYDSKVQGTEGTSTWQAYNPNYTVKLLANAGTSAETKTINIRIRDDVRNATNVQFDDIALDTEIPTVTIVVGLDKERLSRETGANEASFQFQVNEPYNAYKVKLVGSVGATHDMGTDIGTAGGSTGVTGTGAFTSANVNTVRIRTADLETAGANMNGDNVIKVFVQEESGSWSV